MYIPYVCVHVCVNAHMCVRTSRQYNHMSVMYVCVRAWVRACVCVLVGNTSTCLSCMCKCYLYLPLCLRLFLATALATINKLQVGKKNAGRNLIQQITELKALNMKYPTEEAAMALIDDIVEGITKINGGMFVVTTLISHALVCRPSASARAYRQTYTFQTQQKGMVGLSGMAGRSNW